MQEDRRNNVIKDRLYEIGFRLVKAEIWQPYVLKYSKRIDSYLYELWYHPDGEIIINKGRIGNGYSNTIFQGIVNYVDQLNDIINTHRLNSDYLKRESICKKNDVVSRFRKNFFL